MKGTCVVSVSGNKKIKTREEKSDGHREENRVGKKSWVESKEDTIFGEEF